MSTCSHCGAPIGTIARGQTVRCKYCDVENTAPPEEVLVPLPVQVVHNVVVAGAAGGPGVELRCPHCGKRLVGVIVVEVEFDGCGGCGGIWIDNKSAQRVLAQPNRIFGELAERCASNSQKRGRTDRPTCPACPAVLDRVRVHDIELDVCADHGTWFDALELQMLTAVLLGERLPVRRVAARAPGDPVQCVGCGTSMRADHANIGENGPTCDACWRGHQRQLEAEFEAKVSSDGTTVLAGLAAVMLGGIALASRE